MRNDEDANGSTGLSRRTMIAGSAGLASSLAAAVMAPGLATADTPAIAQGSTEPVPVDSPEAEIPEDTVVACIRHAERGEITIIVGETERTFHEPALAKRLLELAEAS